MRVSEDAQRHRTDGLRWPLTKTPGAKLRNVKIAPDRSPVTQIPWKLQKWEHYSIFWLCLPFTEDETSGKTFLPTVQLGAFTTPTWRRGVCTWDTTWGSRRHSRMARLLAISTRRSMKLSCCSSGWQMARYPRYMLTFHAISLGQLTSTWWGKEHYMGSNGQTCPYKGSEMQANFFVANRVKW